MARAFLGLGSNLGNRLRFLRDAVQELPDVVATSRLYETAPMGGPDGQGPYLNVVVQLETELSARELLDAAQAREVAVGEHGDPHGPTLSCAGEWVSPCH